LQLFIILTHFAIKTNKNARINIRLQQNRRPNAAALCGAAKDGLVGNIELFARLQYEFSSENKQHDRRRR